MKSAINEETLRKCLIQYQIIQKQLQYWLDMMPEQQDASKTIDQLQLLVNDLKNNNQLLNDSMNENQSSSSYYRKKDELEEVGLGSSRNGNEQSQIVLEELMMMQQEEPSDRTNYLD